MKRAALLAGLLVVTGCGSKTAEQQTTTAATPKPTPTTTAADKTCPPFSGTTGTHTSATTPSKTMLLTTLQTTTSDCTDRVAFSFRPAGGEQPGYTLEYRTAAEAQTEDASGRHIPIAGKAFLVVRLEPAATADLSGAQLKTTYAGPNRIKPTGARSVREIVKTGDFEGVLTWVIGLSGERPLTVTSSGSRASLTVEIG